MGKERRDHKETLRLLDCLKVYGFDNSAFSLLHFKPNHTIQEHCEHCQRRVKQFKDGDDNSKVQHRLEIVLGAYERVGFTMRSPLLFQYLAWTALAEVPIPGRKAPEQHAVLEKKILELLRSLDEYGFDGSALSLLHSGGSSMQVLRRLEIVLGAYKGGGFTARRSPSLFRHLAWEALVEVPMNPSQGASGQQHAVSDE